MSTDVAVRAPLRISLGGGGTDLPSYYRRHGGFVVSTAIDRYVRMTARASDGDVFRLSHLEREEVSDPRDVRHPILRAALLRWDGRPLDLISHGDVPPGTGLGSSGAYTVCVLKALALARGEDPAPGELAEEAAQIEIEELGRSVGKQDQYAAAHGGFCAYTFERDDRVSVRRLELAPETLEQVRETCLLFDTGESRSASRMLARQVDLTLAGDTAVECNLNRTKELALTVCDALERGDVAAVGELMNEQWGAKLERVPEMASARALELRRLALESGGRGVMLVGAGGGGFLLVQSARPEETRRALAAAGAPELRYGFDTSGCVRDKRP